MDILATAVIVFFGTFSVAEKYLEPWVNDKVDQYYEAKEQNMMWVLVATFIFNGQPSVLSDQKIYFELNKCQEAVEVRRQTLEATIPDYMKDAVYWVWCTQIPQEVQYGLL